MIKNIKITIELTPDDLKEALRQYLHSQGYQLKNVEFKHGSRIVGFHMNEREESYFDGAACEVSVLEYTRNHGSANYHQEAEPR